MLERSSVHSTTDGGSACLAGDESRDTAGGVGGEQASELFLRDVMELSLKWGSLGQRWKVKWEINFRRRQD